MEVKHAVLMDRGMVTRLVVAETGTDGIRRPHGIYFQNPFTHASELWQVCQAQGITHVWCLNGTTPEALGYDFFSPRPNYNIFVPRMDAPAKERPDYPRGGRLWLEGGKGFQVFVGFPEHEPFSWPVHNETECLAILTYLEDVLDVPVQWSPQSIGIAKLERHYFTTARLRGQVKKPTVNLADYPFKQADKDVLFVGRLANLEGLILHVYDKEAAHPSAASHMVTGVGDPHHIEGHADPTFPGIYRITWRSNGSRFDGARLPLIFNKGQEWTTQPMLKFALVKGYEVRVHEAWVFQEYHKLFNKWASELWDSRLQLRVAGRFSLEPARFMAETTIKQIMNSTISATRANWWADMVGHARAAILFNLDKFSCMGFYPTLVYHDAIAVATADPDPTTAIPGILARTGHLGGYKHKYSLYITPELLAELEAVRLQPDGVMRVLNRESRNLAIATGGKVAV